MTKLTEVCFPRSVIPYQFDAQHGQIELIGFADAAELCAGACIYIRHLYPNGSITCGLLLSKSKLVDQTIPRNELQAVLLLAEKMEFCVRELDCTIHDVWMFTDSTIAMCWVHNINKKLKMFVMHKVDSIRRSILRTNNL